MKELVAPIETRKKNVISRLVGYISGKAGDRQNVIFGFLALGGFRFGTQPEKLPSHLHTHERGTGKCLEGISAFMEHAVVRYSVPVLNKDS